MKALLGFTGTTIGSLGGWWLGSQIGFVTACYASVVGMGVGLYFGRLLWQRYDRHFG